MKRFVDVPKLKPYIDPKLKEIMDDGDVWPAFWRMIGWLLVSAAVWGFAMYGFAQLLADAIKAR